MGLFSSSWKYYAFAATTPLFDDETDYPHTFQKVLLQGMSAGDDFSNILKYTLATDMYARAKAMVRYAKREVDPYIRGLPTSNLVVRGGHKNWIENAILREIKMPLEDFFWLRFGTFDAHYVGCKFIHDHYMDIEYFPWPDGCLPDIKNPNFDDGFDFWLPTGFTHNPTERVAELTAADGTLYSEMVGQVNPGDIISLRAVCSRGLDDAAQTGQINLTFYDSGDNEIETFSAANETTPGDQWQLLTVIATAPAGSVTCKAWAGGTIGEQCDVLLCDGLLAWWPFDEASGDRDNLHSPGLYTFQTYQYVYEANPDLYLGGSVGSTTGLSGSAAQINNTTGEDFLSTYFDSGDEIATATSFTIGGWVKFDSLDTHQWIMRKGDVDAYPGSSSAQDWQLYYLKGPSRLAWYVPQLTGSGAAMFIEVSLSTGTWYHVAASWTDGGDAELFLDGVSIGKLENRGTIKHMHSEIHAGRYVVSSWGQQYELQGAMDEWGFWNRQLRSCEIVALYNQGNGMTHGADLYCPSPVYIEDLRPEGNYPYAWLQFWTPASNDDVQYAAGSQINWWKFLQTWNGGTPITDAGQFHFKVTQDTVHGNTTNSLWQDWTDLDVWADVWDYADAVELYHSTYNGVVQHIDATIHFALDDGAGSPNLNTVWTLPCTFKCYKGKYEYTCYDTFTTYSGDLAGHNPTIDRRHLDGSNGGSLWPGWKDVYYDTYGNYNAGYIGVSASSSEANSRSGDVHNETLYAIDAKFTDNRIISLVEFGYTTACGAGIATRIQDVNNFWLLAVKNPDATDPVLGLYKVVGGTHSLAASVTLTGLGPLNGFNDRYDMRLTTEGSTITGEMAFSDSSVNLEVWDRPVIKITDGTFSTETDVGLWADDINAIWRDVVVYPWPLGSGVHWNWAEWDTSPITSTMVDNSPSRVNIYFYEGSNGKTAHPYHSSVGYWINNGDDTAQDDVINYRLTSFSSDTFLIQFQAISGDTSSVELWEYGSAQAAIGYNEWADLFRFDVGLTVDPGPGSLSATIQARIALDDGTGTKTPVAGTETVWKQLTLNVTGT